MVTISCMCVHMCVYVCVWMSKTQTHTHTIDGYIINEFMKQPKGTLTTIDCK